MAIVPGLRTPNVGDEGDLSLSPGVFWLGRLKGRQCHWPGWETESKAWDGQDSRERNEPSFDEV